MNKATTKVGFSGCFTQPGSARHLAVPLPGELHELLVSDDRRLDNAEEVKSENAEQKVSRHNGILRSAVQASESRRDAVVAAAKHVCPEGYTLTSISIRGEETPIWRAPSTELAAH